MSNNTKKKRVIIVDDHPLVIEGLKNVLLGHDELELVGKFSRAVDFTDFMARETCDIILLDITLPDGNGIQLCREVKKTHPEVIILAISNLSERSIIKQMLLGGANGYLLKTADAEDILYCIDEALEGRMALSIEVKENFDLGELKDTSDIPELTRRETQILRLLSEGKKSTEIADLLFISPLTVKTHRATLLQKFQTNTVVVAISKAKECGIL